MKAKSAKEPEPAAEPAIEVQKTLSVGEKHARLRLIRTPHVGPITFWDLLSHFGSAESALEALPEFTKYGSRITASAIPAKPAIEAELERASAAGMHLVASDEPGYPPLLTETGAPPPLLYVKGMIEIWGRPAVAVVGSRRASAAGLKFTAELATELGESGFVIVSGLARGIDAAAHRAAAPSATCAVLAGGLDAIYPPEHTELAQEIAHSGLLMSEAPPGYIARSQDFPRRNRIISGACLGVVVVEATDRSGSLITARLAAEQNREVFAVPGHPFEPRASGTNRLIQEGAVLITGAKDVQEVLGSLRRAWKCVPAGSMNQVSDCAQTAANQVQAWEPGTFDLLGELRQRILELLSYTPIDVDDICRLSGMQAKHVQAALLSLDLAGLIERTSLGQITLKA